MTSVPPETDVVIVGAGPTGLLLAGDVAETGARVVVLERRAAESNLTRAFAVHARTLEQLDVPGVAADLISGGNAVQHLNLLGGAQLDLSILPSRFPFVLITPQYAVEAALEARAVRLGAVIVRGAEVTALIDDGEGVDVVSSLGSVRAAYVVGADGHHSAVRGLLGLAFPGQTVMRSLMLADVRIEPPLAEVLTVEANEHGFVFIVPFGDGWYRVIARDPATDLPDSAPLALNEIRDVARAVLGTDLGMHDARWVSRFHSEERQVESYRSGRVFLAGDAAHVHSPAGGMGMNTGLQDAANLGWKLGAVLRGADQSLLDTYNAERHPVGEMVLRMSGGLLRGAMVAWWPAVRLRNLLLRTATAFQPLVTAMAMRVSGIGVRYHPPPGAHPDVGRRALDFVGDKADELVKALAGGRHVVVLPEGESGPDLPTIRVHVQQPILVRPDGYVAYVGPVGEEMSRVIAQQGAKM